jgi:hypothetical protein
MDAGVRRVGLRRSCCGLAELSAGLDQHLSLLVAHAEREHIL